MKSSHVAFLGLALASLAGACSKKSETVTKETATVVAPPPGEPHGHHEAEHGGIVIMDGNQQHFEILLGEKDGQHRVYFSTAARKPLPASAMDEVRLTVSHPDGTVEDLPMTRDAADASWQASGKPMASPETRIKIAYGGKNAPPYKFELTLAGFLASATPSAAPTAAPAAEAPTKPAPAHEHKGGHQHGH